MIPTIPKLRHAADSIRACAEPKFTLYWIKSDSSSPAGNYMFKVSNRNHRTNCEICSKLTKNTPEEDYWRRAGVFIAALNIFYTVSIVNFEKVNAGSESINLGAADFKSDENNYILRFWIWAKK